MLLARRIGVVLRAVVPLLALLAIGGCGGGGESAAAASVPTAKEVLRCTIAGGGHHGDQQPLTPKGFPPHVEAAMLQGPDYNHIGFYISRRPVFTPRIAQEFDELGEFQAEILHGGRVLMISSSKYTSRETKELAFSCLEG
jgi:hypothetical protein